MKKTATAAILLIISLIAAACGGSKPFEPDYEKAVGMIIVNDSATLSNGILYAQKEGYSFRFENLDAACTFYFDISADESIAGDQNMCRLQLASNETEGAAGVTGTIAYHESSDGNNMITGYYLYYDGVSLYFDPRSPVFTETVKDGLVMKGEEFRCEIAVVLSEPTDVFSLTYQDGEKNAVQELNFRPREVEDYQALDIPDNVAAITLNTYRADGTIINTDVITAEQSGFAICFDDGGQILASRYLRIMWPD